MSVAEQRRQARMRSGALSRERARPERPCRYCGERIEPGGALDTPDAHAPCIPPEVRAAALPGYPDATPKRIRATLKMLRARIAARAAGHRLVFTDDPAWLVNMAINRRAGWLEDPGYRGSMHPASASKAGEVPRKARGDYQRHLRQIAYRMNLGSGRVVIRRSELGECAPLLLARIPGRFRGPEDF